MLAAYLYNLLIAFLGISLVYAFPFTVITNPNPTRKDLLKTALNVLLISSALAMAGM